MQSTKKGGRIAIFTIICFFRVKKDRAQRFVKMANKTGDILLSHGTLEHTVYLPNELTGEQGSMGILNLFELEEDEDLILGQSVYKDEDHYYEVMKKTGSNDMIHYLNDHIKDIVEMNKVITSKFKLV
ncbi:DUF1428 family protein [Halobacillus sp. A1]|nr:DUF1428 family protein [Halobacillus sp. A1]MCP3030167.1 DUF1428 family protein [Halobacillus sp. A1]